MMAPNRANHILHEDLMHFRRLFVAVASTFFFTSMHGCNAPDPETQHFSNSNSQHDSRLVRKVRVLAAASLKDAITEVGFAFEAIQPDSSLQVITGPSNALAQQIIAGGEAHIYLSANPRWATALEEHGLIEAQVSLLSNSLALVVPKGNPLGITEVDQLINGDIGVIAIASPNVPLGTYTKQLFAELNFDHSSRHNMKIVYAADARQTLALVERNEVDAGIVYASDALSSNHVVVATPIPSNRHVPIVYPALLLKQILPDDTANTFFNFLQSSTATAIFERHGFQSLLSPSSQN